MAFIKISTGADLEDDAEAFVNAWYYAGREAEQVCETRDDVESPCNQVCFIDELTSYCAGCGRTLGEIAEWQSATPARQQIILNALPERLGQISAQANDKTR